MKIRRITNWKTAPDSAMVCYCNEVTLGEIRKAIEAGAASIEDVQETTGACTGNMCEEKNPKGVCCSPDIEEILALFGRSGGAPKCTCGHCK